MTGEHFAPPCRHTAFQFTLDGAKSEINIGLSLQIQKYDRICSNSVDSFVPNSIQILLNKLW